jgi:gluconolactonase
MTIFAKDLGFPEAPVSLPDGSFLVVEMSADKGCVTQISADGNTRRILAKTGRPNGLARDRDGRIWVAETAMRAVLKMTMAGDYKVFANECLGEPFLFLNDLAFGPNGDLYVTDSGVAVETIAPGGELNPDYRSLSYDGRVYRIDVGTARVEVIDRGMQFTNGIAFGPDGNLYTAETLTGNVYRYAVRNGQVTGRRELFGNVIERFDPKELKGPDGMKFAADGNLYVAVFGQGNVTVLGKTGEVIDRIPTEGIFPTNLAFAASGEKKIYVTEMQSGSVQVFDVATDGCALHG